MGSHHSPKPHHTGKEIADLQTSELILRQSDAEYFSLDEAKDVLNQNSIDIEPAEHPTQRITIASKRKTRKRIPSPPRNLEFNPLSDPVLEWFNIFHLWDCIRADATEGKPDWVTTNKKHPVNVLDLYKRWKSNDELTGVRFANGYSGCTQYGMLDVDIGSQYHPFTDLSTFRELLMALEEIGLCRYILIRSSFSKGLHVYFPLPKPVPCYKFALAMRQALEQAGFEVKGGQLEIFPNVKVYRSLYAAHRLPLQSGSWVLDEDYQPTHCPIELLVSTWREVAFQQDVELLEQRIAAAKLTKKLRMGILYEWKERLEGIIRTGWTGKGQTNRILMEVCIYGRVFMCQEWNVLESWVLKQILQMPGYREFCGHQTHIKRRIREWVTTNRQHNYYYPCRIQLKPPKPLLAPPNDVRGKEALQRIKNAIEHILSEAGKLPDTVRARQELICKTAKCSGATLSKHRELWHPAHQCVTVGAERVTDVSLGFFNTLESDDKLSSSQSKCVTVELAGVSDSSTDFLNSCSSTESTTQSTVTGDRQLSVYSKLECQEEDRKQEFNQQIQFDLSNQKFLEITVRSTVKRKTDGALFQIRYINPNGTFWAKWLNQYVPLVGVILSEAEVELVSSGD